MNKTWNHIIRDSSKIEVFVLGQMHSVKHNDHNTQQYQDNFMIQSEIFPLFSMTLLPITGLQPLLDSHKFMLVLH